MCSRHRRIVTIRLSFSANRVARDRRRHRQHRRSLGGEPLLVYDGDILSDLLLARLIDNHVGHRTFSHAGLAFWRWSEKLVFAFDSATDRIVDIQMSWVPARRTNSFSRAFTLSIENLSIFFNRE